MTASTLGLGAYLTAHPDARLMKLYIPRSRDAERGGGVRGKVSGFSRASRRRMMERIHRVRRDAALPSFVTLTFPDMFPDQRTAKRRLDTLFKRWKRRWPKTACIWRMEVIDRKSGVNAGQVAPHFHLLVWGHFSAAQAAQDWVEVNGTEGDYAHFKHGTKVEALESWRGAVHYCAKYCAKADEGGFESVGRVWGVHNRGAMPEQREGRRVYLPRPALWRVRRAVRGFCKSRLGRKCAAATLFSDAPEVWVEHAEREIERAFHSANCEMQAEIKVLPPPWFIVNPTHGESPFLKVQEIDRREKRVDLGVSKGEGGTGASDQSREGEEIAGV